MYKDRYKMKKLNRKTIGRNYLEFSMREAVTLEVKHKKQTMIISVVGDTLKVEWKNEKD